MWECAVSISSDKKNIADIIYYKLKTFTNSYENVVLYHEKENIIHITFNCGDIEKFRYKSYLEEIIIEVICQDYKKTFLLNSLNVVVFDEVMNEAFVQALLLFDRDTDRYIVSKYLNIENQINIDGFFNFKLKILRDKWNELVSIANENQLCLCSNDNFVELIKFLVDNIEYKSDVVNIMQKDEKYIILDSDFEQISFSESIDNSNKKLISSLISLCPRNINIYCSEKMPSSVTKLICNLFEKRVRFVSK